MPLALGLSEGEIIASELATVVIGGLFTSTFLTLIVVPVVYSLVEDLKEMVRRRWGVSEEAAAGDAVIA
jgi:HAE1 family hydrophobic/amphiphilic exporter-1